MRVVLVLLGVAGCAMEVTTFTPIPGATCGDDMRDGDEVCDGIDLAGETCESQGAFVGGALGCDDECSVFDLMLCDPGPTVPILRRPANGAFVGTLDVPDSLRVAFAWDASRIGDASAVAYELQLAEDPAFAREVETFISTSTSFTLATPLKVSSTPPVGRRYHWRVRACGDGRCSPFSAVRYVQVGRVSADVNGDGYSDLVIGAEGDDALGNDAGAAYVYFGSRSLPPEPIADAVLLGGGPGDRFGGVVAIAPDLNGDGFADVVVAAPYANVAGWNDAGRVYVYFGGPGPFDTVPDGILAGGAIEDYLGLGVSACDVNADGFGDVAVRGYRAMRVYFGGSGVTFDATPDVDASRARGYAVACVGDVNGDGAGDVVVGDDGPGVASIVEVYLGATDGSLSLAGILAEGEGTGFGRVVRAAGDVNGDGVADVLVGAEQNDREGEDTGRVYLYLGAHGRDFDAEVDAVLRGEATGDAFGRAIASAGDVNADGYDDVVVGARWNDAAGAQAGRAYVFLGGAVPLDEQADGVMSGAMAGARHGTAVSSAGDVNGDGFSDVIVGAVNDDHPHSGAGEARIYLGGPGTVFENGSDARVGGPGLSDGFGVSVGSAARPRTQLARARLVSGRQNPRGRRGLLIRPAP